MNYIAAGQIIAFCNLRPSRRFLKSLLLHELCAGKTKLDAGKGVDSIVNTPVAGNITAGHAAVCRVYNSVRSESCNIPLPEIEAVPRRLQIFHFCNSLCPNLLLQKRVLNPQELLTGFFWRTDIYKRAKQLPLRILIRRKAFRLLSVLGHFINQTVIQPPKRFYFFHAETPPRSDSRLRSLSRVSPMSLSIQMERF